MSTLKVTHLQNESNTAPSISISSAVGGGVTFAGISTFHSSVNIGGNLGIGIDNPESTSQLHIKNTSGNAKITLETNETYDSYINFSGATAEASIGYEPTSNSVIISNSADGLTSNERLRITSGGVVQVNGGAVHLDASGELAVFETDTNLAFTNSAKLAFDFSGNVARIRTSINGSASIRPLAFYTGNDERLRITSGGDLGLGVSANMSQAGTLHLIGGQGVRWQHPTGGTLYGDHYVSATGKHVFRTGSSLTTQAEIDSTGIKLPSGKGINFSAYATSGNPSSNLLDDYEEGTFTPTVSVEGAGGNAVTDKQYGRYVKVGKMVTVWCYVQLNGTPSGRGTSNAWQHGGLPFTKVNVASGFDTPGSMIYWTIGGTENLAGTAPYMLVPRLFNNTAGGRIRAHSSDQFQSGQNASLLLQNNTEYSYTFTYEATA